MNEIEPDRAGNGEPVPVAVAAPEPEALPSEPAPQIGAPSIVMVHNNVMLLTNPRMFFDTLEVLPVSLGMPALIVLAVGVIAAITAYLASSALMNAIAIPDVQRLGGVFGVVGGIGSLIVIVLVWVIITAVFFAISMAFKGRGEFNRLLAYVGYGHLPQVIGGVITLALTWNYYSNLRIPPLTTPEAIQEWATSISSDPALQLANVISLLFLLWSANIWIFGVRSGRKLSTRDAAITVGVPVLLYILIIYVVLPMVM